MKQLFSLESIPGEDFRILLDSLVHGVLINDCEGTILFSNRSHHQMLGYAPDELLGRKVWEVQPTQADQDKTRAEFTEILRTQPSPEPNLATCLRKDGTRVSLLFDWNYLHEEDGSLKGFISIITDLTDRYRRQERLVRANQGLTTLLKLSQNVVGTLDLQNILQETVDGISELMGMGTAAIYLIEGEMLRLAATFPPLPPDFPETLRLAKKCDHPHLARAIDTGTPLLVPDIREEPLTPEERAVVQLRGLRTILYVPLIADEEVMGAFIVCSMDECSPVAENDIDLSCTLANLGALALKNARLFEEKKGYSARLEQSIAEQKAAEREREELQQELFQVQKLDAIGQLAGGVAHDFNNQLSGILGYAELIRLKAPDDRLVKYADQIITLGRRSADLTSQLLAFARKGPFQRRPVNLHQVITEVTGILAHTVMHKIDLRTLLEAERHNTLGDPTQIQNALLNLALNARDAMPDGGEMLFRTGEVRLDEVTSQEMLFPLDPGKYVRVSISDSGAGIDEETRKRIFEPFFTTKSRGEGTGMGLAAVYGTMKYLGGGIRVHSEPGRGTTFELFFPLELGGDRQADPPVAAAPQPGKEILVVDDEESVAQSTAELLAQVGYLPHCYTDSSAALAAYQERGSAIALVLMDMIMPGINGPRLYRAIKAINPAARFLIISGFSLNGDAQTLLREGSAEFLPKPYQSADLIAAVNRALKS